MNSVVKRIPSKLLLIGQAPGRNGDPRRPLEGRIAGKMAELAGVPVGEWLDRTERMNLLGEFRGKAGKGDAWDAELARKAADGMKKTIAGRRVLLLGRNVARAFGLVDLPWLTWMEAFGAVAGAIPHPSGIVLWWNSPENRERASAFLREIPR